MYWEELPEQCPPVGASTNAISIAFRVVYNDPPIDADFMSHRMLGNKKPPKVDDCRFASCSLFTSFTKAAKIATFPKNRSRNPKMATLNLPSNAGHWVEANQHVDFWMFAGFDPTKVVVKVQPCDG